MPLLCDSPRLPWMPLLMRFGPPALKHIYCIKTKGVWCIYFRQVNEQKLERQQIEK